MAKKTANNASAVDEKYLLSLMAGTPLPGAEPTAASVPDKDVSSEVSQENKPTKKVMQTGRSKLTEYVSRFLTPYRCENRQEVYIDRDLHTRISMIIGVVGKRNLTVGNYIDNVLTHHFEQYGEDARSFCSKGLNQML